MAGQPVPPNAELDLNSLGDFIEGWAKRAAAQVAKNSRGFDKKEFNRKMLKFLLRNTPMQFVGYYFTTSNRPYKNSAIAWQGKRQEIADMGKNMGLDKNWGIVPIYVGAQEPDLNTFWTNCAGTGLADTDLSPGKGKSDALEAMTIATNEMFDYGTYVYLDVETNIDLAAPCNAPSAAPYSAPMVNYWKEWFSTITDPNYYPLGQTFGAGLYCWGGGAEPLMDAVMQDATLSARTPPRLWVIAGPALSNNKFNNDKTLDPSDNMYTQNNDLTYHVDVWQMRNPNAPSVEIDYRGFSIDRDLSSLPDPGAPKKP